MNYYIFIYLYLVSNMFIYYCTESCNIYEENFWYDNLINEEAIKSDF